MTTRKPETSSKGSCINGWFAELLSVQTGYRDESKDGVAYAVAFITSPVVLSSIANVC
jgi:hypothetical protein